MKDENHITISTGTEKAFHKFQHTFILKKQIWYKRMYSKIIKAIYDSLIGINYTQQ
jgi:hypothetical protein